MREDFISSITHDLRIPLTAIMAFSPLQQEEEVIISIDDPLPGSSVQGLVLITGTIVSENFQSYQLAFAFSGQSNPNWFTITEGTTVDEDGVLGEWDTATLSDDTYDLRLAVFLQDQDPIVVIVTGIRVRNYSVIETDTPTPTSDVPPTFTPVPEFTSTSTPAITPSPTSLPPNSAEVTSDELESTLIAGGISGAVLFVLLVAIWRIRQPK